MISLFLDTSTKYLCIGIAKDHKVIYKFQQEAIKKQSELTIPFLSKALEEVNIRLNDIDEVNVTIGPGSFTGIRIGMCIAKTLASANNIPLKAISSLNCYASNNKEIVVLDAKAKRCYVGIYDNHVPVIDECVMTNEDIIILKEKYQDFEFVLDAHLFGKEDVIPDSILTNMIAVEKNYDYVTNVDALVPLYLKD